MHGDNVLYPLADINIKVEGLTLKVRAAVNIADLSVTWYCSLVPRLFSGEGKRAWYTLFAHAFN